MESLPGSPHFEDETIPLPTVGVDWNDFDTIFQHMPVSQRKKGQACTGGRDV